MNSDEFDATLKKLELDKTEVQDMINEMDEVKCSICNETLPDSDYVLLHYVKNSHDEKHRSELTDIWFEFAHCLVKGHDSKRLIEEKNECSLCNKFSRGCAKCGAIVKKGKCANCKTDQYITDTIRLIELAFIRHKFSFSGEEIEKFQV